MINRRVAKSLYPASFTKNEMEISNPTDIANKFCDYLTNIGPNLASKIPSTNSSPKDFLSSTLSEAISLQPRMVGEVNNIVKSFNANKAPGPGFSIEGGTRRLIAAYFGIYSRLLCV